MVAAHQQSNFLARLSSSRMVIECAFGRLKGRWGALRRAMDISLDDLPNVGAITLLQVCHKASPFCVSFWQRILLCPKWIQSHKVNYYNTVYFYYIKKYANTTHEHINNMSILLLHSTCFDLWTQKKLLTHNGYDRVALDKQIQYYQWLGNVMAKKRRPFFTKC